MLHPAARAIADSLDTPIAPATWRALELLIGAMPHLGGRTLFFDQALTDAIAAGVDQVVLLGAGFDSRGLRLVPASATVYELDHPATQRLKRTLVDDAGLTRDTICYCTCDFTRDQPSAVLQAAGLDPSRPAFFLWEGVTMYLELGVIRELLVDFARVAAPGSWLCLDGSRPIPEDRITMMTKLRRRVAARAGEPFCGRITPEHMRSLLDAAGFRTVELYGVFELYDRYFAGSRLRPPNTGTNFVVRATRSQA